MVLRHDNSSYATHMPLRGSVSHPLRQNQPSLAGGQDYTSFDDVDITGTIRPPPSALTAATAYDPHEPPSPLDNYSSSPSISHQRSLTGSFLNNGQALLSRATSTFQQHTSRASHSPTRSLASFIPSRSVIESTASQPKLSAGAKALQSWFNGASAPVSLGVAQPSSRQGEISDDDNDDDYDSEEDEQDHDDNMIAGIFNRGPALTRSNTATETTPKSSPPKLQTQNSTAANRFAWLLNTQKNASNPPPVPSPTYHNPSDELLNLNISQSLFPHGPVDPLAPSSFHDLLSNAESLLTRYQTSYRQLSTTVTDVQAEQAAQEDELDEADTRVRHLKMQLETMAARAAAQDEEMRKLMEELTFERRARQEEEAARLRSIALMRGPNGHRPAVANAQSPMRRSRLSNSDVSVDSGFESETESEAASIFSRTNCMSPTDTNPSSTASLHSPDPNDFTPKGNRQSRLVQPRSAHDRARDGSISSQQNGWGCASCEGGPHASVWGRLAREREETNALRHRVEELEAAVEGALDVVDGPWGF
jgi:hypothetical protein